MSDPSGIKWLLLVEDDALVRETIVMMLEDAFDIAAVTGVETALDRLRDRSEPAINVILLDCLLPGGRQSDVLSEAERLGVPVLLISGDPRQAEKVAQGKPFLAKPFTRTTLLAALDAA